jgi:ribosomal protein L16 Arg81 hydroxylase
MTMSALLSEPAEEAAPPGAASALAFLLGQVSASVFQSQHYGQRPLMVAGQPDKFNHLFDWASLNDLLARLPTRAGLNMLEVITATEKRQPRNLQEVRELCGNGHTLIVKETNHHSLPIRDLVLRLSSELGERLGCNLYVSRTDVPGLQRHFDDHDVFVLQLEGSKQWHLFGVTRQHPTEAMRVRTRGMGEIPQTITQEYTLRRGDLLYLPRGWWHEALATDESMHLTIGIYSRTGLDFLRWVVDQLDEVELFRGSIPLALSAPGTADEEAPPAVRAWARDLADRLAFALATPELADRYHRDCMGHRWGTAPLRFPLPAPGRPIPPEAQFVRPVWQRAVLRRAGDDIEVTVWGKCVRLPAELTACVKFIFSSQAFAAADVISRSPPQERATALALLGELLAAGILAAAD